MKTSLRLLILMAVMASVVFATATVDAQGAPPPLPATFGGSVTVLQGGSAEGMSITAKVLDYESIPIVVQDGRYAGLIVSPPYSGYINEPITFYLEGVPAQETKMYGQLVIDLGFDLTFPNLPAPTPTPTPDLSLATPTPSAVYPAVYSGYTLVLGGVAPDGSELVAVMGTYQSYSVIVRNETFRNLVVDPSGIGFIGQEIEFYLNGVKSMTTLVYENGAIERALVLMFSNFPTPTPVPPMATAVPPTAIATPMPPTATPVPPTAMPTPMPPTATPIPPTSTPVPPTATPAPIPPTATAVPMPPTATAVAWPTATPTPMPPTATAVPPTATPVVIVITATPESTGGCSATLGRPPMLTGFLNIFLMFGPVLMLAGYRYRRRKK